MKERWINFQDRIFNLNQVTYFSHIPTKNTFTLQIHFPDKTIIQIKGFTNMIEIKQEIELMIRGEYDIPTPDNIYK